MPLPREVLPMIMAVLVVFMVSTGFFVLANALVSSFADGMVYLGGLDLGPGWWFALWVESALLVLWWLHRRTRTLSAARTEEGEWV